MCTETFYIIIFLKVLSTILYIVDKVLYGYSEVFFYIQDKIMAGESWSLHVLESTLYSQFLTEKKP